MRAHTALSRSRISCSATSGAPGGGAMAGNKCTWAALCVDGLKCAHGRVRRTLVFQTSNIKAVPCTLVCDNHEAQEGSVPACEHIHSD